MADIYANSYLTISATSCQNNQEGFIKATAFEPYAKLTTIPGTVDQYIYIRPYQCSTPPTPLIKRAWVFQERLLSTRVLHFTSLQMVFQCDECEYSELRDGSHGCGFKKTSRYRYELGINTRLVNDDWYGLIMEYSRLKLTYKTDRLPALSGIARAVQQRIVQQGLRAKYVAGLWDNDLGDGLLWSIRSSHGAEARESSPYIAPTWSWASVEGQVWYPMIPYSRDNVKLRVVDIQTHLSTSNPFGEIASAYLIVDAPLRKFLSRDMQVLSQGSWEWEVLVLVKSFAEMYFSFDSGNNELSTSKAIWLWQFATDAALKEHHIPDIYHYSSPWHGLALKLVDKKKQVYKRIGVFSIWKLIGGKRTWDALKFIDKRITII
jgi:hypothetical protein